MNSIFVGFFKMIFFDHLIYIMNRVRKYNNIYQVLVTPHQKYNVGFEFLLGSWTDEGLMGFEVREYPTYYEAECMADQHPDINWDQLVDYHKDAYIFLRDEIKSVLDHTKIAVQFKSQLMTAEQAKNKMFDRVIRGQETLQEKNSTSGFRIIFDMNDIISFTIVNPWTRNLIEIEQFLFNNARLRLIHVVRKNNVTHLIGRTDLGTSYEIILVPSVLNNWMEWKVLHPEMGLPYHMATLKNCIKTQKSVDETLCLR